MTVHKRCCYYYLKPDEICKGHPVSELACDVSFPSPSFNTNSVTTRITIIVFVSLQPVKSATEDGLTVHENRRIMKGTDEYSGHLQLREVCDKQTDRQDPQTNTHG